MPLPDKLIQERLVLSKCIRPQREMTLILYQEIQIRVTLERLYRFLI